MSLVDTVRPSLYRGAHRAPTPPPWERIWGATAFVALLVLALAAVGVALARPAGASASPVVGEYTTPIRGMFVYDKTFRHANDHYHPTLVGYNDTNPTHVASTVDALKYAGMQVAIMTWWGKGQHNEQATFPVLYGEAAAKGLGVIPYYEPEGQGNPSIAQIQADLTYLGAYATAHPGAAVRIGAKPVIFVYNAGGSSCAEITKWKTATNGFTTAYVNMKVFSGFRTCPDQPSSWHQYGPAVAEAVHLPWSFNISPGFWHHNESTPRLVRDPARWATNVAHLKASGAQWQLVTSYNEWGEATSVEASPSWASPGYGTYLDELHNQLGPAPPLPSPTGSATPSPSPTSSSPSPTPTVCETDDDDEDQCPTPGPSPTPSPSSTVTSSPSPTGSPSPTVTPSPTATTSPTASPSPTPPPSGDTITVVAAGDIVEAPPCNGYTSGCQDGWTAELIGRYNPAAVLTLGDNQYESGTAAQYQAGWGRTTCAAPTDCDAWGKHLNVMFPAPGNHEWLTANAQGYRDYFGARLAAIGSDTPSPNPQLYYSYDRGAWHFVSLDSDCSPVGGCGANRPMTNWLLADLAANNGRSTIIYYHHATWSSGSHGSRSDHEELKRIVYADRDVQIVLTGHDHEYERFAPMGQSGPDPGGARYFVVGTGGKGAVCGSGARIPGSQALDCHTMGVLRLTLRPDGYSWQFHPTAEVGGPASSFTDSGSSGLRLPPALVGAVAQVGAAMTGLGVSVGAAIRRGVGLG